MSDESKVAFAKALAAFQAAMPAVGKDQTAKVQTKAGREYTYEYTDLAAIAAKAFPLLAANGLSFIAMPTIREGRGFVLAYSLLHDGGHHVEGEYPLPDPAQHSPQEIGSAITYSRRYTLCAVTGIAPGGEDDDGQAASRARSAPRQQPPRQESDPLSKAKRELWRAAQALGLDQAWLEEDYARQNEGQTLGSATAAELDAYRLQHLGEQVATP